MLLTRTRLISRQQARASRNPAPAYHQLQHLHHPEQQPQLSVNKTLNTKAYLWIPLLPSLASSKKLMANL